MAWIMVAAALAASPALGNGIKAGGGSGQPHFFNVPWSDPYGQWEWGTVEVPIEIGLDPSPNSSPIIKHLREPGPFLPVQKWDLHEYVKVSDRGTPPLPWTDWHEFIDHPQWNWHYDPAWPDDPRKPYMEKWNPATNSWVPIPGLTIQPKYVPGDDGTLKLKGLNFFFPPQPPGTILHIYKQLEWRGPGPYPVEPGAFPIRIIEFPTPEPATLMLLSLGALAFVRRR